MAMSKKKMLKGRENIINKMQNIESKRKRIDLNMLLLIKKMKQIIQENIIIVIQTTENIKLLTQETIVRLINHKAHKK